MWAVRRLHSAVKMLDEEYTNFFKKERKSASQQVSNALVHSLLYSKTSGNLLYLTPSSAILLRIIYPQKEVPCHDSGSAGKRIYVG